MIDRSVHDVFWPPSGFSQPPLWRPYGGPFITSESPDSRGGETDGGTLSPHMQAGPLSYPSPHRDEVVDDLHGRRIPDPYRWLEDPTSAQAVAWSEAEDRLCRAVLNALPGRDHLRQRYRELLSVGYVSGPHWLGHPERY